VRFFCVLRSASVKLRKLPFSQSVAAEKKTSRLV
jgi:hypothetical protein